MPKWVCVMDWSLVLEYLKVLWSWPTLLLVLGFMFRSPLGALISRIRAAKFPGGSFDAPLPQQEKIEMGGGPLSAAAENAIEGERVSQLTPAQVAPTDAGPTGRAEPNTSLDADAQTWPTSNVMLRYVIQNPGPTVGEFIRTFWALRFERTLNVIFGSQLALLSAMFGTPDVPYSVDAMQEFYSHHKTLSAVPKSFSDWLGFLQVAELLSPTAQPAHYRLTPLGFKFIQYLRSAYDPIPVRMQ